jgi:ankyrin repeat protein
MRSTLIALLLMFGSQVGAECGEMCKRAFWETASINDVRDAIKSGEDINQRNSSGNGPLQWASSLSSLQTIKFLVDSGADINARNLSGHTPLVSAKNPEVVEYFLSIGVNVNAKLENGFTTFIFQSGHRCSVESLTMLIDAGADIFARNNYGQSALHWASTWSAPAECLNFLLERGADIEARTLSGNTPLHEAADCHIFCSEHVIPLLLSKGANLDAKNEGGKTAWDLAQKNTDLKGSGGYWALNDARFK